ncbi:hypothetical protein G9A89_009437 [Geosiphon pyriformis]|nr:hypothetical protein G9A89_009437 [Geosiphon pyriformis]
MCLIYRAWKNVSNEIIAHCWHKVGILPINTNDNFQNETANLEIIANYNQKIVLEKIKDCYKEFNCIQPNRTYLSIEELVNLSEENNTIILEHLDDDEIANYIITNRKTKHDSSDEEQEV